MTFKLKIELGNAEMRNPHHVADALEILAARLRPPYCYFGEEDSVESGNIRDLNGNTVGSWKLEEETSTCHTSSRVRS